MIALLVLATPSTGGADQSSLAPSDTAGPCTRYAAGSVVSNPTDLFSKHGTLTVSLSYNTEVRRRRPHPVPLHDARRRRVADARMCIRAITSSKTSPTIFRRRFSPPALRMSTSASDVCGASSMGPDSVNIHFHGTNTSPVCHQDEVIHTLINSGDTFSYDLKFPKDEPPGLYWYHPHVHGLAKAAVQGGASGAIVVEGLEKVQPTVAGLPQRIFVIRDQNVACRRRPAVQRRAFMGRDAELRSDSVSQLHAGIVNIKPGEKQLWRVVNACADTQSGSSTSIRWGGAEDSSWSAIDGVPVGSQDGTRKGKLFLKMTDVFIPNAGRAEFIVTGPPKSVKNATFHDPQRRYRPAGDFDPQRPLATLDESQAPPTRRRNS